MAVNLGLPCQSSYCRGCEKLEMCMADNGNVNCTTTSSDRDDIDVYVLLVVHL